MSIGRDTPLRELAALVSQALERAGITATLAGGGAVVMYSENEYESRDLDFITSRGAREIAAAIAPLGFTKVAGAREYRHPQSDYYVEFPPGPLAFGETVIPDSKSVLLDTEFGPVRIVTPTQIVMDRLAAFTHWSDRQAWGQAIAVARRRELDWKALGEWARREGIEADVIAKLSEHAGR